MIQNHLIAAVVLILSARLTTHAQTSAAIIVYSSTPGGYCAAIAAAREESSVILSGPTANIGGMDTSSLSFSDSNQIHRSKLMGRFHEWHLCIQQDYASHQVKLLYHVNVKDQAKWTYEPHVASRISHAMLAEAGIKVLTGRHLQSVKKSGSRITRIETGNGKQFSFSLLGDAKNWHTADQKGLAVIFGLHKQYTLEFAHFLTNDLILTSSQREKIKHWGLCKDEFADTGHWPPQLYVRESRRIKGIHMISRKDIIDRRTQPEPIMVSSFPMDSHDCQRIAHPHGGVVNEGTIFPVRPEGKPVGYPYHVPYRSILPQPAECDNLLVPVALSCIHFAIPSLRIEATWMLIGQSAGTSAAMAADRNIAQQDLPYADFKPPLLAQKHELELPSEAKPPEVIVAESKRYDSKCLNIKIGNVQGFVIEPLVAAVDGSKPWVWYAPTLGKYPGARMDWLFSRLLKQGFYICGTEVGDSFGSPQSRATYSKFYQHVVKEYGLSPKVSLLPQSRGGLMWYNWAVENPGKVACIGGIYPVCDFTSYPGLATTAKTYGMTNEELIAKIKEHNPIERLAPLAKAKVPIMHLHGDKDTVVPLERNSGELIKRYQALGGPGEIIVIPDKGHAEIAEFFESEKLLEFFLKQGKPTTPPRK